MRARATTLAGVTPEGLGRPRPPPVAISVIACLPSSGPANMRTLEVEARCAHESRRQSRDGFTHPSFG